MSEILLASLFKAVVTASEKLSLPFLTCVLPEEFFLGQVRDCFILSVSGEEDRMEGEVLRVVVEGDGSWLFDGLLLLPVIVLKLGIKIPADGGVAS